MREEIKKVIIRILSEKGELNLTGLKKFKDFASITHGDIDWVINDKNGVSMNILFMTELNEDCILSFYELAQDGIIEINKTDFESYLFYSDEIYTLPLAINKITYKTLRWMPTIIKQGKNFKLTDE